MDDLYQCATFKNVADASIVFTNEVLENLLKKLYKHEFNPLYEIDPNSWNVFWQMYNDAVNVGFKEFSSDVDDVDFKEELKTNNAVFAAFKTHRFQNDIAAQLMDSEGNLKPYYKFRQDVKDFIEPKHLETWLQTEYNTAASRARQAAQWRRFEENADILPNLEWIPSVSPNPGLDHKIFWGTIRPINDPFWDKHRPGDRWNCKCDLDATNKEPTPMDEVPEGEKKDKPAPGLDNNPGKDAILINDSHPYFPKSCNGCSFYNHSFTNRLKGLFFNRTKDCYHCPYLKLPNEFTRKTFKSGGFIETPNIGHQNKIEEKKNLKAYTELAKLHGAQYRLLPVSNEHGKKNPDAYNMKEDYSSDVKVPITDSGKNAIQASISSASKQKVSEVYVYLEKEYSRLDIKRGLMAALQNGRASTIKQVIIRFNSGEIQSLETKHLREMYKKIKRK